MFVHECTACTKRQLIFPSQLRTVAEVPGGARMSFVCWCGAEQHHDLVRPVALAA